MPHQVSSAERCQLFVMLQMTLGLLAQTHVPDQTVAEGFPAEPRIMVSFRHQQAVQCWSFTTIVPLTLLHLYLRDATDGVSVAGLLHSCSRRLTWHWVVRLMMFTPVQECLNHSFLSL